MPVTPSALPSAWTLLLRVFLPFAVGYFLSGIYRTVNAVIADDLQRDLGLGAADLGLLTSTFFLAFACCQLPVGLLLDRYGPRRVEALLLLVAGVGALAFVFGKDLSSLLIGRLLIGIGASACLMASFKAFSLWFGRHQLTVANGYLMAVGGLGAVAATLPVEALVLAVSWRAVFGVLALATLAVAALLWFVVPERPSTAPAETLGRQLSGMAGIFASPWFWIVAPAAFASQALGMAVQGLWAGPWLRDVAGLARTAVAEHLLWMTLAHVAGVAFWATVAGRMERRGVSPLQVATVGGVLFWLVNVAAALQPVGHALILWMLFGFQAGSSSLFYAALARQFLPGLVGRVNASLNLIIFVGAFSLQWGMGVIVQRWPAAVGYEPQGYAAAFAATALLQGLALLWLIVGARLLARRAADMSARATNP